MLPPQNQVDRQQRAPSSSPGPARQTSPVHDRRAAAHRLVQLASTANPPPGEPNRTGLPDGLKAGVERLSGLSLDAVRVFRNSSKPAALDAHAYAQGTEIHLAPGQESHLSHEAWHVVQQAQGRVKPTRQIAGTNLNDEAELEREASVMGERAMATPAPSPSTEALLRAADFTVTAPSLQRIVQRVLRTIAAGRIQIGDCTGENKAAATKREVRYDSDDDSDSEKKEAPPPQAALDEAKDEFARVKAELDALGWSLRPTTNDHCYTEVLFHFAREEDDVEFGLKGCTPEQSEKIVFYSPACPLLDLVHEMDHVRQQEEHQKENGHYLYTNYDLWSWGDQVRKKPESGLGGGFSFAEDHEEFARLKKAHPIDELSGPQNDVAEYHTYMREYVRYAKLGATTAERSELQAKVAEHEAAARKLIETDDADEADPFVEACERIQPFSELEKEYAEAKANGNRPGSRTSADDDDDG